MELPSNSTVPLEAFKTPESTFNKVVLPQPEGPTMLTKERRGIDIDTSWSAVTAPSAVRYLTVRSAISMSCTFVKSDLLHIILITVYDHILVKRRVRADDHDHSS